MKNTLVVAKFTFLEVYRSKLMISLVFISIGVVGVSLVATEFAYGAAAKVALDFGLGITSIVNLIIAIMIGANLISKEIEQRTLYMIISRPISRVSFLIGKIMGLSSVLLINSLLLGILTILLYMFHRGEVSTLFFWTIAFSFFESFIVLLFAVLFSLITNTTLSIIYTILVFVIGHALNETSQIIFTKISPLFSSLVSISNFILPNFYRINLKEYLIYKQTLEFEYLLRTQFYILFYIISLISLVVFLFKNKNLD